MRPCLKSACTWRCYLESPSLSRYTDVITCSQKEFVILFNFEGIVECFRQYRIDQPTAKFSDLVWVWRRQGSRDGFWDTPSSYWDKFQSAHCPSISWDGRWVELGSMVWQLSALLRSYSGPVLRNQIQRAQGAIRSWGLKLGKPHARQEPYLLCCLWPRLAFLNENLKWSDWAGPAYSGAQILCAAESVAPWIKR